MTKKYEDPVWNRTNKFKGKITNCNHPLFAITVITQNYKLTHKQTVICQICGFKLRSKNYPQSGFKRV